MKLRDKHGWPVVFITGKPITNVIRAIWHTSIKQTVMKAYSLPKTCSKCLHEGKFPHPQNRNYATVCNQLYNDKEQLLYCIRKDEREIKRLSKCPL